MHIYPLGHGDEAMGKRERWDKTRPGTNALVNEIVHGVFMKKGTMVAFPTCFPGVTIPIPRDESHITALDVAPDGFVYGGTSGRRVHLFVGMFHGVTGIVFDMGVVEGVTGCRAICCVQGEFVASVNGPGGGKLVAREYQPQPFDLIQEWGFQRRPLKDLGEVFPGEHIVHSVADASRRNVIGLTDNRLFLLDLENLKIEVLEEIKGNGRIAVGSRGGIFGVAEPTHLWRFDVESRKLEKEWLSYQTVGGTAASPVGAGTRRAGFYSRLIVKEGSSHSMRRKGSAGNWDKPSWRQ